ncbi:DotU family type VI secretion system protein [Pseudoduganella albidiflava]|uniref:DotU family type VI secretion system protein n=1 Tax=Pseudoduganella albidiflava TaxID=321983 RepID=A0A411WXA3_9BURK|nr:DotU family type VI secretion system protein [Pseudoduganella albidiflava]QBI01299.1 DotU family type VI secretion system protein [Pseudoduganella albidiflava]GGY36762.1 outer membrane protein [Pseudoduganella albidiflava]
MSQDDPFALPDSEHTVVIPTPGGRAHAQAARQRAGARPGAAAAGVAGAGYVPPAEVSGLNPLVAAANPLLGVVPQLRATLQHPDPAGVREFLAQQVREFERRARAAGIPMEQVIAARYALCTLLDEAAASTPWGGSGSWARDSLLVTFHNEAWGGEKFFQLLAKVAETPDQHRDLLELMYVCLALGLEGRYRVLDNGRAQLEALRERLALLLRKVRGEYERDLSPRWQGVAVQSKALLAALPLWAALGVLGLAMLGAYLGFSYFLNARSDPVFTSILALEARPDPVAVAALPALAPAPAPAPRLAGFLRPEIEQALVAVRDEQGRSVVTLRGDGLFAPGSATVSAPYHAVLDRIAAALKAVPGSVQVIGYTDNQPIRSARFPSNWHLSQERARTVAGLIADKAPPAGRYSAEGQADARPVGDNATAEGRARNRRVEIVLVPAGN